MAGNAPEPTTATTKMQTQRNDMDHDTAPTTTAAPPAGRAALWALIIATALVLVASTFYGLWLSLAAGVDKHDDFGFEVAYAAPMAGEEVVAPSLAGSDDDVRLGYSTISVSAPVEQLRGPQLLLASATAIPFLIVIVGGVGVIALTWRLLGSKPFSGTARGMLAMLGALAILNSALTPWLEARSTARAVEILGLPTDGTQVPSDQHGWVVPPHFDFLQDAHWPYLTLGIVLLLVAMLWRKAAQLQRETEGLV